MRAVQFRPNAPGRLVQATDARGASGLAFVPDHLPPEKLDLSRRDLRLALSEADQALARLDGIARQIERPDLLFSSYLRREAMLSSAIEGTHTTLADLALFELTQKGRRIDDVHVSNYVSAFELGRERVRDLSVGRTLLNELHGVLMAASPQEDIRPGRFRDCIVYIGSPPFEAARFVPPPEYFVSELMDNLEYFLDSQDEAPLIKLALSHYQFETIHPYRDGNGRLGRMLISLWLQRAGILTTPMLYLSAYFERNKQEYYDALLRVSTDGDWEGWLLFFLRGVTQQSRDAAKRTDLLAKLRTEYRARVAGPRVSEGVMRLIDDLFVVPAISVPSACKLLGVTPKPARASIQRLVDAGIVSKDEKPFHNVVYYLANELMQLTSKPLGGDSEA